MKWVDELADSEDGTCYLIGKGQSMDAYNFRSIQPLVCVNDACTGFPGCDYVISGADDWSKGRLNGGYWSCAKVRIAENPWGKADYYYHRQSFGPKLRKDALYNQGRITATSALSLCKLLGFSRVEMVGFGDSLYGRRWCNLNYRHYTDDSDRLLGFAKLIDIEAEIMAKIRIK